MPFPEWFGSGQNEADFLRRVLDHVSDCLVAVDTEGRVVLINEPYCRLLGGQPEDYIGRHITDVVSPKTRLHRVARGESRQTLMPLEVRGHQLLARQVPVYQDGRIIGAVGLALFSNMAALKKAAAVAEGQEPAIHGRPTTWVARHGLEDILGTGSRMEAVRNRIEQAATLSQPVLVQGETGTGKELAASALHRASSRARRPFVWVNCASIPESLIDAELFGYEGGAFTGARSRGKQGKFELASSGTLFLDEIGDMPLSLQSSLLRAVQNQEIVRVGGVAPIAIDTRIVCASHHDLTALVEAGKFRADLYYRLGVLEVRMPALRERDDLEWLIDQLVLRIAAREGLTQRRLPPASRTRWLAYDWPGNVRQLEAMLLRFLVSGDASLPNRRLSRELERPEGDRGDIGATGPSKRMTRTRGELIKQAIVEASGNKEEAARRLGISRATLYRGLRRLSDA